MQAKETREQRIHSLCNEAREKFLQYSAGPAPPDLFVRSRWTMSNVHLLLTDSIQSVYDQADTITEAQQDAFIHYTYFCEQASVTALHHHHWFEETVAFPMVSPEFTCDVLEEHAAFSEAMERWEEYLESLLGLEKNNERKAVPSTKPKAVYDGKRMKKCIEDLSEPLFVHLMHEIDWLAPDAMRASGLPLSKLERLQEVETHHFSQEVDPFSFGCWIITHLRPGSQFPQMPWLVKKVLLPWVFYWKYRSAWQFAPDYSTTGKSQ
ncbi:hypothetical protein CPB86DRAFT_818140 [Serendipita vermifera]|nr:hypothetical protein CPB86DRAFT_818140 [Serendipita vermifera]